MVRRNDKLAALCRILDLEDPTSALVFARTRTEVDELTERLSGRGHDAGALHGGLSQEQRDRVMARFREGALDVLVATDVAARGIHVDDVDVVIHGDPPEDHKAYIHRSGRTARAGESGVVVTLVLWDQENEVRMLQKRLGLQLPLVEIFSNDPRLANLADWPDDEEAA